MWLSLLGRGPGGLTFQKKDSRVMPYSWIFKVACYFLNIQNDEKL